MSGTSWENLVGAVVDRKYCLRTLTDSGRDQAEFLAEPIEETGGSPVSLTLVAAPEDQIENELTQMQSAVCLDHPNLLPILAAGSWDPGTGVLLYLASQPADHTLAHRLAEGPLTEEAARELARDVLAALEYLHGNGLVYGSLGPETTVRVGNRWKLADFGRLCVARPENSKGADQPVEGCSPASVDSDIRALGIMLREALGNRPTETGTPAPLPPPFDDVVRGCLQAGGKRTPSISQLRSMLNGGLGPAPQFQPPVAGLGRAPRGADPRPAAPAGAEKEDVESRPWWSRRALVLVPALGAAALLIFWLAQGGPAEKPAGETNAVRSAAPVQPKRPEPFKGVSDAVANQHPAPSVSDGEIGRADFLSSSMNGRTTASGDRFDSNSLTAAHPSYPLGTHLQVTNLRNGRSVVVRVNDRGQFRRGHVIRVTERVAKDLGFLRAGSARVKVEVVR